MKALQTAIRLLKKSLGQTPPRQAALEAAPPGAASPDDALRQDAHGLRAAKRFEEAITAVGRVKKALPGDHFLIGQCYDHLRLYEEAIRAYSQAIEAQPDWQDAWMNLAFAYNNNQQLPEAIEACQKLLALNPGHAMAHWHLACLLVNDGQSVDRSLLHFHEARKHDPEIGVSRLPHFLLDAMLEVERAGAEAPAPDAGEGGEFDRLVDHILPRQVDVEVSSVCNYKCHVCTAGNGQMNREREVMDEARFRALAGILVGEGVKSFQLLCIGEPFVNPHIYKIIAAAYDYVEKLDVLTNGSRLDVDRLAPYGDKLALHYSLDSTRYEAYAAYRGATRKDFENALENLRKLSQTSVRVYVSTLAMRCNEDHLDEIKEFVRKLGFQHNIYSPHYSPFGVQAGQLPAGVAVEHNYVAKRYAAPADYEKMAPRSERWKSFDHYRHEPESDVYVNTTRPDKTCWAGTFQPWITVEGDVVPCCMEAYYPTVKFGNILAEGSFRKLWFSERYRGFRKALRSARTSPHGPCKICTCGRS